jgi:glycosyltransferase involved in cell wall biosynthesis
MRGFGDVPTLVALRRACREWRPDVIHTQLSRADWIGRITGRSLHTPVVTTIQNVHSRMYQAEFSPVAARLGGMLDRRTAPLASRVIAVSAGVRSDLGRTGVPLERIRVIPNGIDLAHQRPQEPRAALRARWNAAPDDIVVQSVSLLKVQKGLETLVDAAAEVARLDSRVHFIHMGDGPERHHLAQRIRSHGLDARFRLLGQVRDPATQLLGADVFAMPSLWEGLPLALLEAMAAGVPAIGTRVSGIEDVIEDGRSGILVPASNPSALARAIVELGADDSRRRALGEAGRSRVAIFSAAGVADAYRRIYVELLSKPAAETRSPVD